MPEWLRKAMRRLVRPCPLRGGVRHEDVFHDLGGVLEKLALDAGDEPDPQFANMRIRDEAVAYVKQLWDGVYCQSGFSAGISLRTTPL